MGKFFFVLGLFLFLLCPTGARAATSSFEVSGWIPYWKAESGTKDVLPHLKDITTVHPFGFTMGSNGELYDAARLTEEPWVSFIERARESEVRVIPTIMWNDAEVMYRVLSNEVSRKKLIEDIASVVEANGWDGIDIDFENKKPATKDFFSAFLKELYARMGERWVYCTIEARTPPQSKNVRYSTDLEVVNRYCDRVQVMTYDQGGSDWSITRTRPAPYMPLADPDWVEKVMRLMAESIDKEKLILGIPTYGYEYEITPTVRYGYRYNILGGFNPAYGLALAQAYGITPTRNSAGEMSLIYRPNPSIKLEKSSPVPQATGKKEAQTSIYSQPAIAGELISPYHLLWWSDARAIEEKVRLARSLNLRGVAVFKFDGGEDQDIWSILR